MSPFSWQCQNLCLLSLAFIIDWRVVYPTGRQMRNNSWRLTCASTTLLEGKQIGTIPKFCFKGALHKDPVSFQLKPDYLENQQLYLKSSNFSEILRIVYSVDKYHFRTSSHWCRLKACKYTGIIFYFYYNNCIMFPQTKIIILHLNDNHLHQQTW